MKLRLLDFGDCCSFLEEGDVIIKILLDSSSGNLSWTVILPEEE